MARVTIHAAWSPGEVQVAVVADGLQVDYALWRPGAADGVGDLHRGRVTAIVPAIAGAFVALSGQTLDGFLPDTDGAKGLTEGTILTVRITRAAQGGKGPRLRAEPGTHGAGIPGLIRRGPDPLRELADRYPAAPVLIDDPALAATLRADLADRIARVPRAFDDAIETAVEELAASEVTVASGARMSIHPTPALVAIDIDGGAALAGRGGGGDIAQSRHRALNAAILPELARQIRLRDLSGAILVDLAGMKAKQRAALSPALTEVLAGDPLRPRFLGFTALGLAEISRPRRRPPLHEMRLGPLASGLRALREIARASRADPGRRLALRAAPSVVAALEADPMALMELARITGQGLSSRSDPSLSGDGWRIEDLHG